MAEDAITMFKEAAAQLQREEAYLALEGTRKKNDEDEALQQLIGDFNLARIDLNSELSKSADKDQDKVNELNVNAIINTAVNGGDPLTVEEPQQGGCSGSCASCSGCH